MELEALIRSYVKLGKRTAKGFEPCICAACNDYKPRGGFKFDNAKIGYSCFNCSLATVFDPTAYSTPSEKFRNLLAAFGIPDDEVSKAVGKALIDRAGAPAPINVTTAKPVWAPPKTVELPKLLHGVMTDESPWCEVARAYIQERALDPTAYPYLVSDEPKFAGRVIIPYYHRERVIYYQGRAMLDELDPRYLNPTVDKDKLIFNYDELLDGTGSLYVTEGAFDALSIGPSCALSDSHSSEWKLQELRKAAVRGRLITFVVDKDLNGFALGMVALKEGWHVAVMPDGIEDANRCRKQFGRLWLLNHLATTRVAGIAGEVLLRMKCDRSKPPTRKHTHA